MRLHGAAVWLSSPFSAKVRRLAADEAHVHRPKALQALVGAATHSDASVIARTMVDARGGRKHVSNQAFIVVVNKSASDPAAASLARAILEAGAARVVTTELHDTAAPVRGVLTP